MAWARHHIGRQKKLREELESEGEAMVVNEGSEVYGISNQEQE